MFYIALSFSEGVTRHKMKDQTTEIQNTNLCEYFSLVSKACTDLLELKNRLTVRSFSGQFHYRGANKTVETCLLKLLKDPKGRGRNGFPLLLHIILLMGRGNVFPLKI